MRMDTNDGVREAPSAMKAGTISPNRPGASFLGVGVGAREARAAEFLRRGCPHHDRFLDIPLYPRYQARNIGCRTDMVFP